MRDRKTPIHACTQHGYCQLTKRMAATSTMTIFIAGFFLFFVFVSCLALCFRFDSVFVFDFFSHFWFHFCVVILIVISLPFRFDFCALVFCCFLLLRNPCLLDAYFLACIYTTNISTLETGTWVIRLFTWWSRPLALSYVPVYLHDASESIARQRSTRLGHTVPASTGCNYRLLGSSLLT